MPTTVPSGVDIVNALRNESPTLRAALPVATYGNIQDVGNPIMNYTTVANEFLTALVNKIVLTIVNDKMWENPLAFLKSGDQPLGLDVEETYTNPAKAKVYEPNNFAGILTPEDPDVKATYYRRNRRDKYKVTIKNPQLQAAFTSWANFERQISAIVNSLYNGNTIGEFMLTKELVGDAVATGHINQIVLPKPIDEATATAFLTSVRGTTAGMAFPSTTYNNYLKMGGTGDPVVSWSSRDDLMIMLRGDVMANVDVQKLSAVFNLAYADYTVRQVVVDDFPGADNMYAFVCSRNIFRIWENLRNLRQFDNGEVMAYTYWWHCWDTYALSPFENGIAYVSAEYP